jgi:hypothetical protein
MRSTRTILSIIVSAVLIISLFPLQAFADEIFVSPTVTTGQAECIGSDSVAIMFSEYDLGDAEDIIEFGIEISADADFTDASNQVSISAESIYFISGLEAATTYYYRAYMLDEAQNVYQGDTETFTTPAETAAGAIRDSKRTIMSEVAFMNALLEPYGLDAAVLANLPEKEDGYYEELASYANISDINGTLDFSSMPTESVPSGQTPPALSTPSAPGSIDVEDLWAESELLGGRFEYACYIAGINNSRDSYAGDYVDEVVYMYLSHYVDMQPVDRGTTLNYNSNARKFSAWITNYDRQVYDSYLNVSQAGNAADDMREAAAGFLNLAGSTSELAHAAVALTKSANTVKILTTAANARLSGEEAEELGEAIGAVVLDLNDDKTSEEIINDVIDGLDGHDFSQPTKDFITSTAVSIVLSIAFGAALVTPGVGILVGAAILAANIFTMSYLDIYQGIAWIAMEQSLSGRIPGRILRYYGI